jgi:hypothetical protein
MCDCYPQKNATDAGGNATTQAWQYERTLKLCYDTAAAQRLNISMADLRQLESLPGSKPACYDFQCENDPVQDGPDASSKLVDLPPYSQAMVYLRLYGSRETNQTFHELGRPDMMFAFGSHPGGTKVSFPLAFPTTEQLGPVSRVRLYIVGGEHWLTHPGKGGKRFEGIELTLYVRLLNLLRAVSVSPDICACAGRSQDDE